MILFISIIFFLKHMGSNPPPTPETPLEHEVKEEKGRRKGGKEENVEEE
jgi:hypothetical protein